MAISSGQFRMSREFQCMDLSAWQPAKVSLATANTWTSTDHPLKGQYSSLLCRHDSANWEEMVGTHGCWPSWSEAETQHPGRLCDNLSSYDEKCCRTSKWKGQGERKTATNWQLKVDLGKQLKFPQCIARMSLRPDFVLTPDSSKHVAIIELTVPQEDSMKEAHERKKALYLVITEKCRRNR